MDREATTPAPDVFAAQQVDRAVAELLGADHTSPVGHAIRLSSAGDGGAAGAETAPAVSPPRRRSPLWRWLLGEPEPSDAEPLIARYRREYRLDK